MSNAATELAALLDSWSRRPRSTNVRDFRTEVAKKSASNLDAEMVRGMALVGEIRLELDRLAALGTDTSMFEPGLKSWWRAIAMPDTSWGHTPNADEPIGSDALNLLKSLGALIDARRDASPISVINREAIQRLLDAADDLVTGSTAPEAAKRYISTLVAGVRDALTSEDPQLTVDWVLRLLATITFIADIPDPHEADSSWRESFKNFAKKWGKDLAVAGLVEVTKIGVIAAAGMGLLGA
jgi:hypothetical protein